MRSSERSSALRGTSYCCASCGVKQSKKKGHEQKVVVHHKEGVLNWDEIIETIRKNLLCSPDKLEVLCPDCHDKAHE
jgi:predicted HNH restriction endonuclease